MQRFDLRITNDKRKLTIRYEGYVFPDKESALDFAQKKAMCEFGPGPWDRGEITIGTTLVAQSQVVEHEPFTAEMGGNLG